MAATITCTINNITKIISILNFTKVNEALINAILKFPYGHLEKLRFSSVCPAGTLNSSHFMKASFQKCSFFKVPLFYFILSVKVCQENTTFILFFTKKTRNFTSEFFIREILINKCSLNN